jgi:hypothetical protein
MLDIHAAGKTPAQEASFNSIRNVKAKNKAGWLDLFAADAVLQDPVGVSPLDVSGEGHKGLEAIGKFWDLAIASGDVVFELQASHPCGDECANVAKLSKVFSPEMQIHTELVIVYRVNSVGKICSLKAYWEYAKVQQQLDKAFA